MKLAIANALRAQYLGKLAEYLTANGEDVALIASNVINLPIVTEDGEEGWIEISVKVPKGTKDEEYDGYARRDDYTMKCEEKAEKQAKKEAEKAKKIAKKKKEEKAD